MNRKNAMAWAAGAAIGLAAAGASAQQYLMVPDSTADRIILLNGDGTMNNATWIPDAAGSPYDFQTPKDAIQVGSEVWVSDQISDAIFRFAANAAAPSYIGTVSGQLDNMRGMHLFNGVVYVANAGTANGAPGAAIVMFDTSGTRLGHFACPDPFDIIDFEGDLLITNIAGDNIERFTTGGVFVSTFHDSDGVSGIDFPQQLARAADGGVLCAGFSPPIGLFVYDASGAQTATYAVGSGDRGVHELAAGEALGDLLYTDAGGIHRLDLPGGTVTDVLTGASAQYIGPANFCRADYDGDGFVTGDDFALFVTDFEAGNIRADIDGDGFITGDDFGLFVTLFEIGC